MVVEKRGQDLAERPPRLNLKLPLSLTDPTANEDFEVNLSGLERKYTLITSTMVLALSILF